MAQATYQKQRVIDAATKTAASYREQITKHYQREKESKEKRIMAAMQPRWWRGARTREKAELIIECEDRDSCLWMYPTAMYPAAMFLPYDKLERAESILKLAKTTDGESVTLTEGYARFLFI